MLNRVEHEKSFITSGPGRDPTIFRASLTTRLRSDIQNKQKKKKKKRDSNSPFLPNSAVNAKFESQIKGYIFPFFLCENGFTIILLVVTRVIFAFSQGHLNYRLSESQQKKITTTVELQ